MLTPTQATVLKAAILGNASLAAARAAGDQGAIAVYYNANAAGSIWRPSITAAELNTAIVWSQFIALTAIVQNGYNAMLLAGTIDATSANVRAGFASIFSGQSLTNLTALAARAPTRFEALFTVSNVCSCFGQSVTVADVAQALGT